MSDSQGIKNRINRALNDAGVSQRDLARKLGKSSASVSEMLSKPGELDSIKYIEAAADLTGFTFEWLRTGKGSMKQGDPVNITRQKGIVNEVAEAATRYLLGKEIRPVTVTVDPQGHELITYVNVKAQAGYLKGYEDPVYIEHLPAFNLPILKKGSYRMFEVDGDSMLQMGGGGLHDGDIVIAQYVEDIFSMKDRRVYVLVTTEGVSVKRCINRLKETENPVLVCQSDNKNGQHPDFIVRPHEIIEVWELKAFISKQLGFATDIWDLLSAVETKVALMDEKIDLLSG